MSPASRPAMKPSRPRPVATDLADHNEEDDVIGAAADDDDDNVIGSAEEDDDDTDDDSDADEDDDGCHAACGSHRPRASVWATRHQAPARDSTSPSPQPSCSSRRGMEVCWSLNYGDEYSGVMMGFINEGWLLLWMLTLALLFVSQSPRTFFLLTGMDPSHVVD